MTVADFAVPLLRLRGVSKSFGSVHALTDVDLDVPVGAVTALAGDNGAGKSVLIKCIAGIHQPASGEIYWDGRRVRLRAPREASALGIETVYQDLALCDNLDIVQNMFLGRERLRQKVSTLSGGQRQAVALARAVLWNSRLVIMDEPTAALGVVQTETVLSLVRRLADRGLGVIIISHSMNDVYQVADRIAVLYLGRIVGVMDARDTDRRTVVELMTIGASSDREQPVAEPVPTAV